MKVNRNLTVLALVLTLLAIRSSAVTGQVIPPRPPISLPEDVTEDVIPAWALATPPSSSPGRVEAENGSIEPDLLRVLLTAKPDEPFRVIVHLHEQADPQAAAVGALNVTAARFRVVGELQATAARSQASLRAYLAGARAVGAVHSYTPFWVVNGIAVHADRDTVFALAARPEVAAVHLDHYRQWLTGEIPNPKSQIPNRLSAIGNPQSIEWGVAHIRADDVWHTLHISGTGTVVAGVDTGVDWLHPALQANYRGYNPHGLANHTYSWHDATNGGALYPVDGHGHGSHTLGTIAGQDGIGVAPGARWIAVKVLSNQGYGYDSWIHEGLQWLLAPGGDPAQAPDVINCSWGSSNGYLTTFQADLQALKAAGIFAVFSNGNDGPGGGTVGSPASLPEAFAIGASDADDGVAYFSSRGPSPWGEIRPHVVAPGVIVRSALPGGAYGEKNGTSMAAPHVAGIVALLRSVSPTLSIAHSAYIITSTAVPITISVPNNDSGWGRVDSFAAVSAVAHPGFVTGTVTRGGDGAPVAGATVAALPHGGGGGGTTITGDDGAYLLALAPTSYDVTASAFGYDPVTIWGVVVATDTTTMVNLSLTALPTGTLRGAVTDAVTGDPVTAVVTVLDTPVETIASQYTFALPSGDYIVRARSLGYRIVTQTVHVDDGGVTDADFSLPPAPSILLVDSGRWHYESEVEYFRQALDELTYAYDEWTVQYLPGDVPTADDLAPYDIVIWSAPKDAPGFIGAQNAIVGYLDGGGRLLLTGQDVGFWDGGGVIGYWDSYYNEYLKADYVSDDAPTRVLDGLEGDLFAGLTLTITGAGGADNQAYPDEVAVSDPDAAAPVLVYQEGECGGVRVGTCLDYRVIYLSFGFEGINASDARREVMSRSLDWLTSSPPDTGLELTPSSQTRIGLPGTVVTHTLRVRHMGQGGTVDNVSLLLDGAAWTTQLSPPSLVLSPCASATVVLSVTIPAAATWDTRDTVTLTARSSLSPTLMPSAILTTKVPAPVLLVDDDRWYDQEAKYEEALASGDFPYDYWRTGWAYGETSDGSPSLDILQRYPIVLWFTGYDWYAPLTDEEEATLADYLDGGGRLFLSAQDYLYYHSGSDFSRDYLGVLTYTEDVTPTLAQGVPESLIGDRLGPYSLVYPFRNWSDALVPTPGTAVSFREQARQPIALARQEGDHKTVFFSFPFETLPETGRAEVMERIAGWLSWLGGSTFAPDRGAVSGGDTLTYTALLRNDGPETISASLSNTLPVSLTLVPGSVTGPGSYDPVTRRLSWSGSLDPGLAVTFTYRATVATGLPAGTAILNTARLGLDDHATHFHRAAVVRVGAPDLPLSAFSCTPSPAWPGAIVTCTLALRNTGVADASTATISNTLSSGMTLVPGSASSGGVGTVLEADNSVAWEGIVGVGEAVTITYQASAPPELYHGWVYDQVFVDDGTGGEWERAVWLEIKPLRYYFPLVFKDGS
ncbi:MAG: S8 family serine peptidase [Chloroflexota bacterium]|nr:S8 family serine peptidase [Chloroflexota bacterium]